MIYIYFIQARTKGMPIKIGVAENIPKRLSELQTGNHAELTCIDWMAVETKTHAYDIEARMHRLLKKRRIRGEWFKSDIQYKWTDEYKAHGKDNAQFESLYSEQAVHEIEMAYIGESKI